MVGEPDLTHLIKENHQYVHATLREGDKVYASVGIHMKGAAGSSRGFEENPGLTVSMTKFTNGLLFHGLRKFNLNNSVQDPSFLTDLLCSELFRQAGVPASRIGYARLNLNGRDRGLYLLVEGFNKDFFRRNFENANGNFYDGGFLKDINAKLEKLSGPNPEDQSDLKRLAEAAQDANLARRKQGLERLLDLDRFISFMALEVITWDWDGYPLKSNNYRVYHDPRPNKMIFLPHGMDQMFWDANGPIAPEMVGLVARAVMGIPDYRERYFNRISEIMTNIFKVDVLETRIDTLTSSIVPAVAAFNPGEARKIQDNASELKKKIRARAISVHEQLARRSRPLTFDSSGAATVTGWAPRLDSGEATLSNGVRDGQPCLTIVHRGTGPAIASWRSKLQLPPGKYDFRAEALGQELRGIQDEKGVGIDIRISGGSSQHGSSVASANNWQPLTYAIESAGQEVELICELRAQAGSVSFKLNSLVVAKQKQAASATFQR